MTSALDDLDITRRDLACETLGLLCLDHLIGAPSQDGDRAVDSPVLPAQPSGGWRHFDGLFRERTQLRGPDREGYRIQLWNRVVTCSGANTCENAAGAATRPATGPTVWRIRSPTTGVATADDSAESSLAVGKK